jgi:hypothetical protein
MSTLISRLYSWVVDKTNSVKITASKMDAENDQIIVALNRKTLCSASAPDSPIEGQTWIDTTNKLLKIYLNNEWVIHGPVHIAASAAGTPFEGMLWYDTTNNLLKAYNGSAWDIAGFSINTLTEKATLVTNDIIVIEDSAASYAKKKSLLSENAAAGKIPIMGTSGYMPDATVDTTALKTALSEVSNAINTNNIMYPTGGTYCFYPQFKTASGTWQATLDCVNGSSDAITSYTTTAGGYSTAAIFYVQHRYITASGQDHWLFLLMDKNTKEIISASSALDHPAYGNGGDFDKVSHPFGNYDKDKHEIVLVDNDTIAELKAQVTEKKSLLTIVNEEMKVADKEEIYKPLHSGRFLGQEPELVQTIPDYIKVRKLVKLNATELQEKENKRQLAIQKAEQDKIKKEQNKQSAISKLKTLGLTDSEIEALK